MTRQGIKARFRKRYPAYPSPDWWSKHGSWHSRQIHKLLKRLEKAHNHGSWVEGGWGEYGEEIWELRRYLFDLSNRIYTDKKWGTDLAKHKPKEPEAE